MLTQTNWAALPDETEFILAQQLMSKASLEVSNER